MATYETILEATVKAGVEHFGGFPSGTMIAFAGKSVPDGWLLCNGALVSRTTYAKLFAAIGTAWGAGDGSTTFKLPDADGRVMQGATDASKVGQYLEAGLPNITGALKLVHNTDTYTSYQYSAAGACFSLGVTAGNHHLVARTDATTIGLNDIQFNASKSEAIYSGSSVQAPALQTLIIIKV